MESWRKCAVELCDAQQAWPAGADVSANGTPKPYLGPPVSQANTEGALRSMLHKQALRRQAEEEAKREEREKLEKRDRISRAEQKSQTGCEGFSEVGSGPQMRAFIRSATTLTG